MTNNETTETNVPTQGFVLGTKLYDKLKFIALVLLPAVSTLYFSLGKIWDFPNVTEVIGSITSIDTFLGVILGLSTKAYNKSESRYNGALNVSESPEGKLLYSFELNDSTMLDQLSSMDQVVFKVKNS